jgi:hypothetical protein
MSASFETPSQSGQFHFLFGSLGGVVLQKMAAPSIGSIRKSPDSDKNGI